LGEVTVRDEAAGMADAAAVRADEDRRGGCEMEELDENGCWF
jgi:hypothetical protein